MGYYEKGVFINRRLIFLKPDVLIAVDECYAGAPHTYRWFFHFGESGIVSKTGNTACWNGEHSTARLWFTSSAPLSAELRPGRISRHYNHAEENIVLENTMKSDGFASIFYSDRVRSSGSRGADGCQKTLCRFKF